MDDLRDLSPLLQSRFPPIRVWTHEEARVVARFGRVCKLADGPCFRGTVVDGLRRPKRNGRTALTG